MPTLTMSREFQLTDRDFEAIAGLVHDIAGIYLADSKRQLVYTRLSRRLRQLGLGSFADYIRLLEGPGRDAELGLLLNAITTNLTSFFREPHHFDHLAGELRHWLRDAARRRLRIWSSACSTGEEPYSIAMTLAREDLHKQPVDAKILATDIDTSVLDRARGATYPPDAFRGLASGEIDRFTRPVMESSAPMRRIRPEIASMVHCKRLNLVQAWPMKGPFDVIFCRNVLIYFDASTKARLIDRFCELLRDGGFLYLGHSESLMHRHPGLKPAGRTTYRRVC